jgi:hypothetical protein
VPKHDAMLSPDERRGAVAAILARGVRRVLAAAPGPVDQAQSPGVCTRPPSPSSSRCPPPRKRRELTCLPGEPTPSCGWVNSRSREEIGG